MTILKPAKFLSVSAPARICLFGEHSDYLGLAVITAAIDLRLRISGTPRSDMRFHINLPDIHSSESFDANGELHYIKKRDYYRSVINVLRRRGVRIPHGFDCEIHSEIPKQAGCASSSALIIAWIAFLLNAFGDLRRRRPMEIAWMGYEAEVLEFGEPGGWMDHFTSALGGLLHLDCGGNRPRVRRLPARLGKFVLADSLEPKDTLRFLQRVRSGRIDIIRKLEPKIRLSSLRKIEEQDIEKFRKHPLSEDEFLLLRETIRNRAYAEEGLTFLSRDTVDPETLGVLLNRQHDLLRDTFRISTAKIDRLREIALEHGARGGKINGSGGGGCLFVYSPQSFMKVAQAVRSSGGKAYVVDIASGVRVDEIVRE